MIVGLLNTENNKQHYEMLYKLNDILKNETVFFNIDIIGNLAKTGNW